LSYNIWQSKSIRLRAVEPSDWEFFTQFDQDSDTARRVDRIYFPKSRAGAREWAERMALRPPEGDLFMLVIENDAGQPVGSINSHTCERANGTFKYGVSINRQHRGKGHATEAICLLLRYFFEELRYQKVTAHVYSFNEESIRLHRRLGFQQEGLLRRMVYTQGQYHDELLFGMTAEEFQTLYAAR